MAQASELAFFPLWSYAHPRAIELAERLATYAPGDLNRVFFTTGGGEAVETAWKLAKQYFKLTGKPTKHKVISRNDRLPRHPAGGAVDHRHPGGAKAMFEPLVPGGHKVPNTNIYPRPRAPARRPEGVRAVGRQPDRRGHRVRGPGDRRRRLPRAGAELRRLLPAAARLLRAGPRDLRRVRRAARLRRDDLRLRPHRRRCSPATTSATSRHHHHGQGHHLGYAPLGADDRQRPALRAVPHGTTYFPHGYTFGGHPVSCAVAMANLDIFEREGSTTTSSENAPAFRAPWRRCSTCRSSATSAAGYFYGIELVKDKATRETFDDDECERLLRGYLSKALFDAGLYCRADDRGDPVIQLAPPLTIGPTEFDDIERRLRRRAGRAGRGIR
jgi:adenosylmethionine-8-amino-7-oxononanoate aminotransferase